MKILAKSLAMTTFVMTLAICCLHSANSQSLDAEGPRYFSSTGEIQAIYNKVEGPGTQPFLFAMPQSGVIAPAFAIEMSLVNPPDKGFQMRLPGRSRVAVADDIPLFDSYQVPESITSALQIEGVMNRLAFQDVGNDAVEEKKSSEKKSKKPVVVRRGRKILNLNITRSGWRKQEKKKDNSESQNTGEDSVPTPPAEEQQTEEDRPEPPSIPVIPPAEPALD